MFGSNLFRAVVNRRLALALLMMLAVTAALADGARADETFCTDPFSPEMFGLLRDKFIRTSKHGAAATQPVTTFLTDGGEAKVVFRKPATDKEGVRFRVFEIDKIDQSSMMGKAEMGVISVAPAAEKEKDNSVVGFLPADSTLITFDLVSGASNWSYRRFVLLRCVGGKATDWGLLQARTSNQSAAAAICAVALICGYFLAMLAVTLVRKTRHPLAGKYPAYRAARQIDLVQFFNPIHLTADSFHRASVQKLQIVMFSFLVGAMLLWLALCYGILVNLSPTIIGLLGISGIGATVAQISATTKDRMSFENWSWLVRKGVLPINEATPAGPRWRDLVTTNREFDVYKLQTVIFSVAVAVALLAAGAPKLAGFEVPQTLLGILGLSQVVYIGGILVRPPSIGDLDKAVGDLRKAEETAKLAVTYNVDADIDGNLRPPAGAPSTEPFPVRMANAQNALRRYRQQADLVEIMIESTLETAVERHRLDPDLRDSRRTLGPEGGSAGVAFSIDPDDSLEIAQLSVWSGTAIDAFQIVYRERTSHTATSFAPKVGGGGGGLGELRLQAGEYITRVEGRIAESAAVAAIVALSVRTNLRSGDLPALSCGGSVTGRDFAFWCEEGEEIIGFGGRSGTYINALGVIIRPRR